MAFYTYTQDVDYVQPAKTFMDDFKNKIIAVTGWSFIEEVTSGTRVTQVFKSAGANNSFGQDFYVGVCRTTLTSNVGFILGEGYNSGTKKLTKPAVYSTSGIAVGADGSYATDRHVCDETTLVASTAGFLGAAGGNLSMTTGMVVPTGGRTFWSSITADRIMVGSSGNSDFAYLGYYDSFHAVGVDAMPLIVTTDLAGVPNNNLTTSTYGCFTRTLTKQSTTTANVLGVMVDGIWGFFPSFNGRGTNNPSTWSAVKEAITNKYWLGRIPVLEAATFNAVRGLLKDCYGTVLLDSTVAFGDTMTVDGVTYAILARITAPWAYNTSQAGSNTAFVLVSTAL